MNRHKELERESVVGRVSEFLRLHPPFDQLDQTHLAELASHSSIIYKDEGQAIFESGDELHDSLYVIRKGEVKIQLAKGDLIDRCAEGEIFGARAFMSSETYQASAIAEPEALMIKLPIAKLRELLAKDPRLTEFFFGDFSSGVALRKRKLGEIQEEYKKRRSDENQNALFENTSPGKLRKPVSCKAETSIREAAQVMREHGIGSIVIVSDQDHPVGIVTDTDLRNKVVAEEHPLDDSIDRIMSHPVKTVAAGKSTEEYLMEMVVQRVHHLCITENGTADAPLLGVITDHDLLLARGNNAAVLLKELRRSKSTEEQREIVRAFDGHVKKLVLSDHPILLTGRLVQSFNREVLRCLITEELEKQNKLEENDFCWLVLGSSARAEQIIRTDFDSAIILKTASEEKSQQVQKMAETVFEKLISLGYHSDPAGIQANNPEWAMSLEDWKKKFQNWMSEPTERALLHATIFFDLMPFYGDEGLGEDLQDFIYQSYRGNKRFTAFLAGNALKNPAPLGFFKNLLLEKGGEHKDTFDIKARAMMPLADAARLQSLEHNCMFPANTVGRYQRLMQSDPNNASRYEDCAVAYEIFMRVRAQEGLQHNNDGRYIRPSNLSALEKQVLKKAFEPIASIQQLIKPI